MTDIKDNKKVLFDDFDFVQCSQYKEFNYELEMTNIQKRLYFLMVNSDLVRGKDETLYGWCKRIGLAKSTALGIFSKNNTKMHDSVAQKIADSTGVTKEWVKNGVGEPFNSLKNSNPDTEKKENRLSKAFNIDKDLLEQAFNALDDALQRTNKQMPPKGRSRFISALYDALKQSDDTTNIEILEDCIYTIEEALNLKRQLMSPKSKVRLILAIYGMYSETCAYKDVMQSTIKQLIGSLHESKK